MIEDVKICLKREDSSFEGALAIIKEDRKETRTLLRQLHPEEKTNYESFPDEERRASYLLGRVAAKRAVQRLVRAVDPTSICIGSGVFQFPVVKGVGLSNVQASISHCEGLGFCAAFPEAHPLGVDVEIISRANADIVSSQLSLSEKQLIRRKMGDLDHTVAFSMKEALSKILRTGMMLDFQLLEIDTIAKEEDHICCTFRHFSQYKAYSFCQGSHVFSLALPGRTSVELDKVWAIIRQVLPSNTDYRPAFRNG